MTSQREDQIAGKENDHAQNQRHTEIEIRVGPGRDEKDQIVKPGDDLQRRIPSSLLRNPENVIQSPNDQHAVAYRRRGHYDFAHPVRR